MFDAGVILSAASVLLAGAAGWSAWHVVVELRTSALRRARARGDAELPARVRSLGGRLMAYLEAVSHSLSLGRGMRLSELLRLNERWFPLHAQASGVDRSVTAEGFAEAKARLAVSGAFSGFLFGFVLSGELATLLFLLGAAAGWHAPRWAVLRQERRRLQDLERHLPEMLDVVSLGMRSGLSFDASIDLYARHFDTLLARSLSSAQAQWSCGIATRDEALREIARSYDSPLFARTMEGAVRSLRFGSAMVDGLEASASEARSLRRSRMQERVAKAPVKMMIPTGALILPAMLILVLGPVLLELAGGLS